MSKTIKKLLADCI